MTTPSKNPYTGVGEEVGDAVTVGVDVFSAVGVNVAGSVGMGVVVGLGGDVCVDSAASGTAGVGVNVEEGRGWLGVEDNAKTPTAVKAMRTKKIVSSLPMVRPKVEENKEGIRSHKALSGLIFGVSVRMPRAMLI
jgi:hypothetical protein